MSKFFGAGNPSSDDDSSNNQQQEDSQKIQPNYRRGWGDNKNEEARQKIQTEKDKKWGQLKKVTNSITNTLNNKDFDKVWENLQQLLRQIQKAQKLIEKQGYPPFFLKILLKVNDVVNSLSAEEKKKMNKNSITSFNSMRQKLKGKIIPAYEKQLADFKEKGIDVQSDITESEPEKQQSEESEEDDAGDASLLQSEDPMVRRRFWLKKKVQEEVKPEEEKPEVLNPVVQIKKPQQGKKAPKFNYVPKEKTKSKQGVSSKEAEAQLLKMIKNFYKLSNQEQRQDYLNILNDIVNSCTNYTDSQKLSIYLTDIPIRVQVCRQMKLTNFLRNDWKHMFTHIQKCYQILRQSEAEDLVEGIMQFTLTQSAEKVKITEESIYNTLKAFVILLQSELKKAFTYLDSNDAQYAHRLQDLIQFVDFMYKISKQMNFKNGLEKSAAEVSFKVIENMYFMNAFYMAKIKADFGKVLQFVQLENQNKLQQYANSVLKYENQENVTKTILYLAHNHAINYRKKARDILTMSNVPNIISKCDYYTQCIYNRVIAEIGLCAFHDGKYQDVQHFLSQVCGMTKNKQSTKDVLKQFLAQSTKVNGVQIQKNKILPYYLHLDCQLIQSAQLIASMIQECPYLLTENARITSKTFRRVVLQNQRSHFIAEPIHNKDLIYSASKSLRLAKWKQTYDRLMELQFWDSLYDIDVIKANLLANIKQQSLRCYLIGNRKCFTSVSIEGLAKKFELTTKNVKKLVSRWIYQNKQLKGSITNDGYLQLIQKKQSYMQKVSQQLFVKLQQIMKANETIYENRVNMFVSSNNNNKKEGTEDINQGLKQEEDIDKQVKPERKTNKAMTEKLKATLNKRL